MPTPAYDGQNVAQPANVDQLSGSCPAPLTPPPETTSFLLQNRSSDGLIPTVAARDGDGCNPEMTFDNTGAGMALFQEDSMYMSPEASPVGDTVYNAELCDKNLVEDIHDDSQHIKAASSATSVGSLSHERTNICVGSISCLFSNHRAPIDRSDQDSESGFMSQATDREHGTAIVRGGADVHDECSHTLGKTNRLPDGRRRPAGMAKIDRELDWSSQTCAWDFSHKRIEPRYPSSLFQVDSRYSGTQQSDRQIYNVHVRILTIDMDQCTCTGFLTIKGLTPEHDTLQTYFTGEIIGGPSQKYSFRTKNAEWGASDKTDLIHWPRFPAWRPLMTHAKKKIDFEYPANGENWWHQDNIFMRWKEHFLVPDHKTRSIAGASFEGFYYICLNQVEGKVDGIYFHSKSEKFQRLELKHEGEPGIWHRGVTPCIEFR